MRRRKGSCYLPTQIHVPGSTPKHCHLRDIFRVYASLRLLSGDSFGEPNTAECFVLHALNPRWSQAEPTYGWHE